jgi:hypothetical protein
MKLLRYKVFDRITLKIFIENLCIISKLHTNGFINKIEKLFYKIFSLINL